MVVLEIINNETNKNTLNLATLGGYGINDYICSWIYKDKKEFNFFKEHELELQ
jgi:hypothetical protein